MSSAYHRGVLERGHERPEPLGKLNKQGTPIAAHALSSADELPAAILIYWVKRAFAVEAQPTIAYFAYHELTGAADGSPRIFGV